MTTESQIWDYIYCIRLKSRDSDFLLLVSRMEKSKNVRKFTFDKNALRVT